MIVIQHQPCIDVDSGFVEIESVLKAFTSFLNASNSLSFSDIKVLKFSLKEHRSKRNLILGAEMELKLK